MCLRGCLNFLNGSAGSVVSPLCSVQALGAHPVYLCSGKHCPFLDNCFLCVRFNFVISKHNKNQDCLKPNKVQCKTVCISLAGSY